MNENSLLRWLALAAIVFGLVTVAGGGRALFGSVESRAAVDHAVPLLVAVPLVAISSESYHRRSSGCTWQCPQRSHESRARSSASPTTP